MKNIAILSGGDSGEYEISIKSGKQYLNNIDKNKYTPYLIHVKGTNWNYIHPQLHEIPVDKNDFSLKIDGQKIKFDAALIAIHGTPGENGLLQSYFELLKIPYTTCGVMSSALTFNKYATKHYLAPYGIDTAKALLFHKKDKIDSDEITKYLGLPCFIKPNNGGSSCGVSKISNKNDIKHAIEEALEHDDEVIVEEYLHGTEITCGVFKTAQRTVVFPIAEIVSKKEFFDYEAKYTSGMADEIIPARIPDSIKDACQKLSSLIYDKIFCRGVVRIDYIIKEGKLFLLEINTVPGMTEASIVPRMIKATGMNMTDFITELIEDAFQNGC
jgi:D-alanine-D-alanine ligase